MNSPRSVSTDSTPLPLEEGAQLDLLGRHALGLDDPLGAAPLAGCRARRGRPPRRRRRSGPWRRCACRLRLGAFEVDVEVIERVLLDLAGQAAQRVGIGVVAKQRPRCASRGRPCCRGGRRCGAASALPRGERDRRLAACARLAPAAARRLSASRSTCARCSVRSGRAQPVGQPADVHEAARIARDQHVGRRRQHVVDLQRPHRRARSCGKRDRERPAEAAALLALADLDDLDALDRAQQRQRALGVGGPARVARAVERDPQRQPPRPARDAEVAHDEVAQLPGPLARARRPRRGPPRSRTAAAPRATPSRAHEPDGTTTGSSPPNTRSACRATVRAAGQSPLLNAGWPQQVWSSGNTTSHPRCSSTSTVARATSSKNASQRQVAISWTRRPIMLPTLYHAAMSRGRPGSPVLLGEELCISNLTVLTSP